MPSGGTIELIGRGLGEAFAPLTDRLGAPDEARNLLHELGLVLPDEVFTRPAIAGPLGNVASAAGELPAAVATLTAAIDADQVEDAVAAGIELVARIATLVGEVASFATALDAVSGTVPGLDPADVSSFAQNLPDRLLRYLAVAYLDRNHPAVLGVLYFVALAERVPENAASTDPALPPSYRWQVVPERIRDLFEDPLQVLANHYAWGDAGFDGEEFLQALQRVLDGFRHLSRLEPPSPGALPELVTRLLTIRPRPDLVVPGIEAEFHGEIAGGFNVGRPLSDGVAVELESGATFGAGATVELTPPADLIVRSAAAATGRVQVKLIKTSGTPGQSFILIGLAGGPRFEAMALSASAGVELAVDGASGDVTGDAVIEAALAGGKIVIDLSGADGFLAEILPEDGFTIDVDVLVGWSGSRGIYFQGSSALEIELPVNLSLGPLTIPTVYISLGVNADGTIALELSTALQGRLGPLSIAIDRMGMNAVLSFPDGGGNLNFANLAVDFKPPTAVGLAVDAGAITGGGFLNFDPDNERYEGILQLSFSGQFTMTAIALITTRMPDGSKGFSLLIIISAEFTPIQLGFGFTLNGVGGLLGLHRTIVIDALREGIKNERVDDIMFPEDPIANAPRLLSDLRTIFPARQDQFLVGPMAKLGWGTPTLLTAELAVVIELPDPVRIVILGVLKIALPDEDAAILQLQVNFLGVLDFEAGELWFEANLYDSRLLTLSLSGGMAFRLNWGNNPGFLMSVGGFHPAYDPPSTRLPAIDRLTLSLLPTDNPRLTLEAYFAVTSNTVQFGARIELYAGVSKFNVYGWLGFDALFQFDPFMFIAEVSAGLAVRIDSSPILSVNLKLMLKGPTPYNAVGTAKFKILFFSFKVRFNETWGESRDTSLPAVEVLPLVLEAMADPGNWEAITPFRSSMLVTTRAFDPPDDEVVIHPFGSLTVRQKVAPLGVTITKYGSGTVAGDTRFDVTKVMAAGDELSSRQVRDEFAPAQYFDLSDSEKLSRASFEQLQSGVTVGSPDEMAAGAVVPRLVAYEQCIIDVRPRKLVALLTMAVNRFRLLLRGGSMARSDLAQSVRPASSELSPAKVAVAAQEFAVVSVVDMAPVNEITAMTQTEALQQMQELVTGDPALADQIQVISSFEVAGV